MSNFRAKRQSAFQKRLKRLENWKFLRVRKNNTAVIEFKKIQEVIKRKCRVNPPPHHHKAIKRSVNSPPLRK